MAVAEDLPVTEEQLKAGVESGQIVASRRQAIREVAEAAPPPETPEAERAQEIFAEQQAKGIAEEKAIIREVEKDIRQDVEAAAPPAETKQAKVAQEIFVQKKISEELSKRRIGSLKIGTKTGEVKTIVETQAIRDLEKNNPKLFKVLQERGLEPYKKAVAAETLAFKEELKRFKAKNKELPDGAFISIIELNKIRKNNPEAYNALVTSGFKKANRVIDKQNAALVAIPNPHEIIKANKQFDSSRIQNPAILKYNPSLVSGRVTAQDMKPGDLLKMQQEQGLIFALTFGAVPLVGTALYWETMKAPQRAASIGLDILALSPLPIAALRFLKGLNKLPGVSKATNAIKVVRNNTRRNLAAITNKKVVAAYDDVVKAGDKYARNLADIEATEKLIKTRPGGPLKTDFTDLELLKGATKGLKHDVVTAGNNFSNSLRATNVIKKFKAIGGDMTGFTDDFGSKYAADIETVISKSFRPPQSIKALKKRLDRFRGNLKQAQFDGDTKRLANLATEIPQLKAEIRLAFAARARDLFSQRLLTLSRIAELKKILKGKKLTLLKRKQLKAELRALKARLPKIERNASEAAGQLAIETAPDTTIKRGGGNVLIKTPRTTLPKGGVVGGGVRTVEKTVLTPAVAGFKVAFIIPEGIPGKEPGITPTRKPGIGPSISPVTKPSIRPGDVPKLKPKEKTRPAPTPKAVIRPGEEPGKAPGPGPTPTPTPEPAPEPEPAPVKPPAPPKAPPVKPPPFKPPPPLPRSYNRDEDNKKRRVIQRAKGAIAWRQGELHGKDRWDIVTSPFTKENDYLIVLGRKPQGAIIVKGPGSAKKTAQLIFGHRLEQTVLVNQPGIFATKLQPTGTRRIVLTFHKDAEITKKVGSLEEKGSVFPLP